MNKVEQIYKPLLKWYNPDNKQMPWRKSSDPYKIWISEIMLQQTQVSRVVEYYERWIRSFPSIKSVALASETKILNHWAGLGYYNRAHNFHMACKILLKDFSGSFPNDINDFIALPGVGDYISCAVFSIAFNTPVHVYDVNVNRLISRIMILNTTQSSARSEAKKYLQKIVVASSSSGILNQAIMDYGRDICTTKAPKCTKCLLSSNCKAYINNMVSSFPIIKKKNKRPHYRVVVGFVWNKAKVLINKRPKHKMLGGMWEFPGGKIKMKESPRSALKRELMEEFNINVKVHRPVDRFVYKYSHFSIDIEGYMCEYVSGDIKHEDNMPFKWIKPSNLYSLPFPSASEKFFNKLL